MAEKLSVGKAIDAIIKALQGLDEKTRANAIAAACNELGLSNPALEKKTPPPFTPEGPSVGRPTLVAGPPKDIRTLKEEKNPESAVEMACIVAYYLMNLVPQPDRKETVGTDDMEKYFKQANFRLRKKSSQLLIDAKRAGYFDSVGRGAYRLNAVGHNLVAHSLPRKKKS